MSIIIIIIIINPRRECARVTLLDLSVCVCVCVCVFPYSGTSRNQAYKQQYQRLQHDTGMKYKKGFFVKTLRSEVMASFAYRDSPRRHSSALEILKLFKRLTVGYALPGTPLDIRQKARVLWQSLSLLSQRSEHVTIPHNFRICMRGIPRERHGYTDIVFTPPTYCRLLASSTHFIIHALINATNLCWNKAL